MSHLPDKLSKTGTIWELFAEYILTGHKPGIGVDRYYTWQKNHFYGAFCQV
jgi:hypothetical protein